MKLSEKFIEMNEPLASGLYEETSRSLFYRIALGLRRYFENLPIPEYNGEMLYPSGIIRKCGSITPSSSYVLDFNLKAIESKEPQAAKELRRLDFFKYKSSVPKEHTVGGNMFTHSMPNFERILAEGLESYFSRIEKIADIDMREGLIHLLDGIKAYHKKCVEYLESINANPDLVSALKKVPFKPAENIYEAVVCWNFILYLDFCDNLGALANGLLPFYKGENIIPLLENLYQNLDVNDGFSMQLGFSDDKAEEELTLQCLKAAFGKRRPMIELFVDENTSNEVWQTAIDCIRSGSSAPAFYNKSLYKNGIKQRFPQIDLKDLNKLCGGGCTEMMISGLSNVGSLDAGINLPYILTGCIEKYLASSKSFNSFYNQFFNSIEEVVKIVTEKIAESQILRAKYQPHPLRSLLIDNCIENGLDYNNGGAKYNWSIINYSGIVNVIDSLLVIKDCLFENEIYSKEEFIELLKNNDEEFLKMTRIHKCRHGIDDSMANKLSFDFTSKIFKLLSNKKTVFGFGFLPSSIQFMDYARAGSYVGATPDGRASGSPLADSLAAIFGKDTKGPTALIKSVTAMDLKNALGTPVFNLTIAPKISDDVFKSIIESYIELGGMQVQITCTSKEMLEEAYKNPDNYRNLIVRVGGYSEYFYRLSDEIKRKVLERTFY